MSMATRIQEKLCAALSPQRLEIRDDSSKHEGHAGWRPGGGTHFHVEIVSEAFSGKNRVERQRMVYALLKEEFAEGLHALQLVTRTLAEEQS